MESALEDFTVNLAIVVIVVFFRVGDGRRRR